MRWLSSVSDWILNNKIVRLVTNIFFGLAAVGLAIVLFLTAGDVVGRYVFDKPILGANEITSYLMTVCLAGGLAYRASQQGHVKIELLVNRLSVRAQAFFDVFADLISLFIVLLLTRGTFAQMMFSIDLNEVSQVLSIPAFPFVAFFGLGFAFFALILVADLFKSIARAVTT
jgi:TRAP-type C4-dicarboxylate transport system permease small subunit